MTISRFLPAITLLLLTGCQKQIEVSQLWGRLEGGSYDVGLRVTTFVDSTRVEPQHDQHVGGRPIEVALWYPASESSEQTRLRFRDYVELLPHHWDTSNLDALHEWLSVGISGDANAVGQDTLDRILTTPMRASFDALPSPGQFPLVFWTMRHETIVAQSVLGEYLASHGYVVASARYAGPALPMPWTLTTKDEKLSTFATHLQDMTFALERLERESIVDSSRIAISTWSYAAELASRVQVQHANIQLVIGLSSNPLSPIGLYQGTDAASHLDVERLIVPYVVMTERIGPNGQERAPPAILTELPSESYYVSFTDLGHGNFNVLEGMVPGVFGITRVQPWSTGGAVAQLGYEAIARNVLSFLDHYLKKESAPEQLDRTWEEELPAGFVTVTRYGSSP